VRALLISTYDLGRQPFGLASAAAALSAAGIDVSCADLAKERLREDLVREADFVAFFLPMHTATRLALPVVERVRSLNPAAQLAAYGLYAPLNEPHLRTYGIRHIVGGEFEDGLVACALAHSTTAAQLPQHGVSSVDGTQPAAAAGFAVPRVTFRVPLRDGLPDLSRYATLQVGSERRAVGYTEASRGCRHRCRHCPIVPVYDGRFRVVPIPIVVADVRTQVAAGARHITFGDPDFFNGIGHATALIRAFAAEFAGVSYDVTIKIEHLVRHAGLVPLLRETGCLFVTSAVESVDDGVLAKLEKGHTRADFERVAASFRSADLTLMPTFVAFSPWTTVEGYCDLLQTLDRLDLVDQVAPIQLAIRLLIPQGSRLLELPEVRAIAEPFSAASLTHPWRHRDSRVDALQRRVEHIAGEKISGNRRDIFEQVWHAAHDAAGIPGPCRASAVRDRATIPYLNEPWYC
jgi:radical SAM superfamily enzyme YgiQ (UPF0313 family)